MDPNACFAAYCGAVEDGELALAYDCQENYQDWLSKGGFPAEDAWGDRVSYLDPEQDRYGIGPAPPRGGIVQIESFRRACRENVDGCPGETDYDPRGPR